jgi:hypothetical protein
MPIGKAGDEQAAFSRQREWWEEFFTIIEKANSFNKLKRILTDPN